MVGNIVMKIKEFQEHLEKEGIDLALFYNAGMEANPNFFYFSGFGGIGAAVIGKSSFLLVPKMELERAERCSQLRVYPFDKKKFFESVFYEVKREKLKCRKIGIDKNVFSLNAAKSLRKWFNGRIVDVSKECSLLRQVKAKKEVGYLKKSCSHADRIIKKCIANFSEFKTESDAAAFLAYETKKSGLELSFNPIVASGKNASMPHYEPSNTKLNKGFCVVDFGVKHRGYCSDITRTIYLGKPSLNEKKVYSNLLAIQKNAVNLVKENKKCSELYYFVVKSLGKDAKYFTHGLGHGIGVEIHELPNLTLNSKDRIKDNMAFTIEPGIYIKNKLGIRIEDSILFSGSAKILTKASKDLLSIS